MNTCSGCTSAWTGKLTAHCPSCHRTFSGVTHFDAHRREGRCLDPAELGMELLPGRTGDVWGRTQPQGGRP